MLAIDTYTNKTGACQPQTPNAEEPTSVLLFGNNDSTDVPNCQPSVDTFLDDFLKNHTTELDEPVYAELEREYECGSWYKIYTDPTTGLYKSFPLPCGKFRICEICHERRMKKYQWRVQVGLMYFAVAVIPLEDPQVAELVSLLEKDEYLRLPAGDPSGQGFENGNGGALFFKDMDEAHELIKDNPNVYQVFEGTQIPEGFPYNWDQLTNTPDGKRPSGNMGSKMPDEKKEEEEDEDDDDIEVAVDVKQITVNTEDKPKFSGAMLQAIAETSHLNPKTLGELQDALEERTEALERILKERGVNILFRTTMTMHVKISHMKWSVLDNSSIDNSSIKRQKTGEQLKFT